MRLCIFSLHFVYGLAKWNEHGRTQWEHGKYENTINNQKWTRIKLKRKKEIMYVDVDRCSVLLSLLVCPLAMEKKKRPTTIFDLISTICMSSFEWAQEYPSDEHNNYSIRRRIKKKKRPRQRALHIHAMMFLLISLFIRDAIANRIYADTASTTTTTTETKQNRDTDWKK